MEHKKFKDIQVGDYLFCASQFGFFVRSKVYKVEHCNKISKIYHDWYGQQNLNGEDSCNYSGSCLRYVATSKEELEMLMKNGVKDYDKQINTLQKLRAEFVDNLLRLSALKENEIYTKNDD